jgi:hypothetical protein
MPVSVTLGGDPVYTYAATAPLPEDLDEYLLAGFLRRKKVEMVKCLTNDLEVPSDVDFVIIRCGYGNNIASQDDKYFAQNVAGCEKYNIPYGIYIYSYALNTRVGVFKSPSLLVFSPIISSMVLTACSNSSCLCIMIHFC